MQKIVKIAVVLASIGFISSAYANSDFQHNATGSSTSSTNPNPSASSGLGSSSQSGARATDDQVFVGESSTSPAAQSTGNQGSIKQEHNNNDEDLD
ncbi:MAG: hypothetical protein AB7I18_00310 [Candidatus Berkiella sp.]